MPFPQLFSRLTELTGIQLLPQAEEQLERNSWMFEFVDSDVQEVHARPRFMDIIDYAEAKALASDVQEVHARPRFMDIIDYAEAKALASMADRKTGNERQRLLSLATEKVRDGVRTHAPRERERENSHSTRIEYDDDSFVCVCGSWTVCRGIETQSAEPLDVLLLG